MKYGIFIIEGKNMAQLSAHKNRLSIDLPPEEHRKIKAYAALHGVTIREYVLESLRERLRKEQELRELSSLSSQLDQDSVLNKLWNNDKDTL